MSDSILSDPDREEALSRAYIDAIAAGAGYTVSQANFDRDGVDVEIKAGGKMRPSLALQLKATVSLGNMVNGTLRYALRRRNYDLLRIETQTPRLLVLLDLPRNEAEWLTVTLEEMILKRCAFWVSLSGSPESENAGSVTIDIPVANVLDIAALRNLMERSRTGKIQ